jgi:Rrf2 family protein
MQITNGVEQAIYVISILSRQKDDHALKSHVLSKILNVSDSYLKKIIRKLVVSGIVNSSASKTGGISLNKSVSEITFLDIFNAIEGNSSFLRPSDLWDNVLKNNLDAFNNNASKVISIFSEAEDQYKKILSTFTIGNLLEYDFKNFPPVDWNLISKQHE